ncbi:B9 domain-containing protein 2 [Toxocara canis]|uniref:B9 domain-containing protein 2 n=1 Tax=Toxocara canis TaxID=6265 RepID=A0A0B2VAI0_TOXCA|nr:B9 domain-containing protein 2 [Toxocara canis]
MAEVHVIGEIESGSDFPDCRLFCKWNMQMGGGWRVVEGETEGQTQTDLPEYEEVAYFSHPIDVHLATKTIQGWPRINIQVWHYDEFGRQELYGYGSTFLPSCPGEHEIVCHTWRPKGGFREEIMQHFIGGGLQLNSVDEATRSEELMKLRTVTMGSIVCHTWRPKGGFREEIMQHFIGGGLQLNSVDEATRSEELMKLRTVTMGSVKLHIFIITRHFDRFGIQC